MYQVIIMSRSIKVLLKRQAFIIDELRVKMLIKIDILTSEDIDLAISIRTNYINSYRITFKLIIVSLSRPFIKQKVVINKLISIPARAYIVISIEYIDLPFDNYIFEPIDGYSIALFAIVVNLLFYFVLARNNLNRLVYLSRRL